MQKNTPKRSQKEITRRILRISEPLLDWGVPQEAIDLLIEVEEEKEDTGDTAQDSSGHAA